MKKLLLILALLSLVGCDSLFLKKGKGILRHPQYGATPSNPGPEDPKDPEDPVLPNPELPGEGDASPDTIVSIEVVEEVLYLHFAQDIGWVTLSLIEAESTSEVWQMELDSSLGTVEITIPESVKTGEYELRLTAEWGEVILSERVYIY